MSTAALRRSNLTSTMTIIGVPPDSPLVGEGARQTLDLSSVVGNLLRRALQNVDLRICLERACVELVACGVPVGRAHIALNTLHPLFRAVSYTWYPVSYTHLTLPTIYSV